MEKNGERVGRGNADPGGIDAQGREERYGEVIGGYGVPRSRGAGARAWTVVQGVDRNGWFRRREIAADWAVSGCGAIGLVIDFTSRRTSTQRKEASMSNHKSSPHSGDWDPETPGATAPRSRPKRRRILFGGIGLAAGVGLLVLLPGTAAAHDDGYSYGHAELSLGFPQGSITVGKTWENPPPRQVVVEKVTHKFPDVDGAFEEEDEDEEEGDYGYHEEEPIEEEYAQEERVIIEKRRPKVVKKVTIVERYVEPACDPVVIHRVHVEPVHRTEVIVHQAPRRVVHRVHVHHGGGRRHHVHHGHGRGHGRGHGHGGAVKVHHHGPRDLFPEDGGRPHRSRGVQRQLVRVGGHSH
jgi:hypothetical protein